MPKISGRFTKEEDEALKRTLEAALLTPNQFEAPPRQCQKAVLCGEKSAESEAVLNGKTYRNWVRQIWADVHAALPQRSRTAVYDRGLCISKVRT